jgi:hypothetical protein
LKQNQASLLVAQSLIAEALKPSPLETNLRRLSDEIGGRIPGTPAFQRAVDWAVSAALEMNLRENKRGRS